MRQLLIVTLLLPAFSSGVFAQENLKTYADYKKIEIELNGDVRTTVQSLLEKEFAEYIHSQGVEPSEVLADVESALQGFHWRDEEISAIVKDAVRSHVASPVTTGSFENYKKFVIGRQRNVVVVWHSKRSLRIFPVVDGSRNITSPEDGYSGIKTIKLEPGEYRISTSGKRSTLRVYRSEEHAIAARNGKALPSD